MVEKKTATKAEPKKTTKKCSSTYGGGGTTPCTQPEGHDGPHMGADNLTWP